MPEQPRIISGSTVHPKPMRGFDRFVRCLDCKENHDGLSPQEVTEFRTNHKCPEKEE